MTRGIPAWITASESVCKQLHWFWALHPLTENLRAPNRAYRLSIPSLAIFHRRLGYRMEFHIGNQFCLFWSQSESLFAGDFWSQEHRASWGLSSAHKKKKQNLAIWRAAVKIAAATAKSRASLAHSAKNRRPYMCSIQIKKGPTRGRRVENKPKT